jgi:ABC-type antimicrobial peptide transport system permease subunit
MAYVVRSDRDSAAVTADVRAAVAALDPRLPIYDARPLATYVEGARSIRRFTMVLAAAFAFCALALACIGIYGVLAYAVAHRRHEFGVRRALGADTPHLMRGVLREGLRFAVAGCAGGLIGAALAAQLLESQLYVVDARDPVTYGIATALIVAGATLACWIPAHRATVVTPMEALRAE